MKKRILIIAVLSLLAAALLAVGFLPIHGEAEIYDTVVRLHILANSDSEEDQALKLSVRDAILEVTGPLLAECSTREEALEKLNAHLCDIQSAAEETIASAGKDDTVSLLLGTETYPERTYDSVCFPSGEYLSLRVCIGEAQGHNWWCCLFPPLCLNTAKVSSQKAEDSFVSVGLTPSQYKIITETQKPVYKIRFKILELFR